MKSSDLEVKAEKMIQILHRIIKTRKHKREVRRHGEQDKYHLVLT